MSRLLSSTHFIALAAAAGLLGCGSDGAAHDDVTQPSGAVATCSDLAREYKDVLESDASLCTAGDDATCAGRRPIWGVVMDGDTVLSYGLSECPVAGSGAPVNPSRTDRLDELLARYRDAGCTLPAGPGCGIPGRTPAPATCVAGADGSARCE